MSRWVAHPLCPDVACPQVEGERLEVARVEMGSTSAVPRRGMSASRGRANGGCSCRDG